MTSPTTTAMLSSTTTVEMADEYDYADYDYVEMTLPVQISTGIGLAILILVGVSGNAMTITAYATDKTPKTAYDFVIFQLAMTDLLISCISMPFYAVYTLMGFTWPFGYAFCKIWLTADFTFCLESIFLMLLLSLDRLLLLTFGSHYSVRMTLTIARIQVMVTWILSFLVYGPAILAWNHWVGYSTVEEDDCDVEFAYDFSFTASTSIVEFVLPFICLSGMNAVIYLKIRRRLRGVGAKAPTIPSTSTRSGGNVTSQVPATTSQQPSVASTVPPCSSTTAPNNAHEEEVATRDKVQTGRESNDEGNNLKESGNSQGGAKAESNQESGNSQGGAKAESNQTQVQAKREVKAARFLAILVVVFLLLWAPYTVTTMVIAFCGDKCLNVSLYEFFNWVLWIKSAVNPLLYALNSSFYRRHFVRYLRLNGRLQSLRTGRVGPA